MDKTPQLVSGTDVFGPDSRFYYSIRTRIDPAEYPQVHDFYEIILVTGGELGVLAAGARFALRPGGLLLLRPGDAHTKLEQGPCTHIDLAFPAGTARELVCYLYQDDGPLRALAELPLPPQAQLTAGDAADVQDRLARLNRLPPASAKKSALLRALLPDLFSRCLLLAGDGGSGLPGGLPAWLAAALEGLDDPANLGRPGLAYLAAQSGRSPEHICRCFRRYFGCTPSAYWNRRRLDYAVNLLTHTDLEIVDVVYESGFQSTNYFYHLFKRTFGMSPLQYKKSRLPRCL